MPREKQINVKVTGPITLEDLRWLVYQCEDMPGESRVTVVEAKAYSQLDHDPAQIIVHGS